MLHFSGLPPVQPNSECDGDHPGRGNQRRPPQPAAGFNIGQAQNHPAKLVRSPARRNAAGMTVSRLDPVFQAAEQGP